MLYNLTNDFIKINETKGTIQNASSISTVEVSDKALPDSGFLLFPLNQISFSGNIFLRCIDGAAVVRVISFAQSSASSGSSTSTAEQDSTIEDIWNDSSADSSADSSSNTFDSDFDNVLDNIFSP